MRAAIYTRVSTQEQAQEGFSLAAQLERLNAYCLSQGWDVADIYTDEGISAKDMERPQLQRMLSDMQKKMFDVVLVVKLDRLTRSVADLHNMLKMFDKYGIGFKSATEIFDTTTAVGRLFITIIAAIAQWERETIGERVREGQGQMVREGRYFGHTAPYGYELCDGTLHLHPTESEVVRKIFDLYLGGYGASRIAKYLNDPANHMLPPHNSKEWSQAVITRLTKNPAYAGYVRYGNKTRKKHSGEMVLAKGPHEPIITEEEHKRVFELIEQRKIKPSRSGTGIHPLVGVLRCGLCGGPMIGHRVPAGQSGRVTDYNGYLCNERRHKRTCTMKMWKREFVESAVIEEIQNISASMLKSLDPAIPKDNATEKKLRRLESELAKLKNRRAKTVQAYTKNFINDADMKIEMESIDREEQSIKSQLASIQPGDDATVFAEQLKDFAQTWEIANPDERRELIRDVAQTIWIYEDGNIRIDPNLSV